MAGLEAAERREVDARALGDLPEGEELTAYPTVELRTGEVLGGQRPAGHGRSSAATSQRGSYGVQTRSPPRDPTTS